MWVVHSRKRNHFWGYSYVTGWRGQGIENLQSNSPTSLSRTRTHLNSDVLQKILYLMKGIVFNLSFWFLNAFIFFSNEGANPGLANINLMKLTCFFLHLNISLSYWGFLLYFIFPSPLPARVIKCTTRKKPPNKQTNRRTFSLTLPTLLSVWYTLSVFSTLFLLLWYSYSSVLQKKKKKKAALFKHSSLKTSVNI